jgi:hypothetical protein
MEERLLQRFPGLFVEPRRPFLKDLSQAPLAFVIR